MEASFRRDRLLVQDIKRRRGRRFARMVHPDKPHCLESGGRPQRGRPPKLRCAGFEAVLQPGPSGYAARDGAGRRPAWPWGRVTSLWR